MQIELFLWAQEWYKAIINPSSLVGIAEFSTLYNNRFPSSSRAITLKLGNFIIYYAFNNSLDYYVGTFILAQDWMLPSEPVSMNNTTLLQQQLADALNRTVLSTLGDWDGTKFQNVSRNGLLLEGIRPGVEARIAFLSQGYGI